MEIGTNPLAFLLNAKQNIPEANSKNDLNQISNKLSSLEIKLKNCQEKLNAQNIDNIELENEYNWTKQYKKYELIAEMQDIEDETIKQKQKIENIENDNMYTGHTHDRKEVIIVYLLLYL